MEPNYSTYSENELQDALAHIDKHSFPERVARLQEELAKRQASNPKPAMDDYEVLDSPSKFYACPSCDKKVGMFSRTMNKSGKIKHCPHCHEPFIVRTSFKSFLIFVVPVFVVSFFLLRPILTFFDISTSLGTGIACGLMVVLTLRLNKVRITNAT